MLAGRPPAAAPGASRAAAGGRPRIYWVKGNLCSKVGRNTGGQNYTNIMSIVLYCDYQYVTYNLFSSLCLWKWCAAHLDTDSASLPADVSSWFQLPIQLPEHVLTSCLSTASNKCLRACKRRVIIMFA